jgi:transcriptional regulator with XRE-family HTH domain
MDNLSEILKNAREEKNLSLKDVSVATKIRLNVLKAIEQGNFDLLPPVYMKSFIKEYINYLQIDYEKIKIQLEETLKQIDKIALPKPEEETKKPTFSITTKRRKIKHSSQQLSKAILFIYLALGLSIVAIVYFTFFYTQEELQPPIQTSKRDTITLGAKETSPLPTSSTSTDSMSLEFKSIDTVWINMIIDNKISESVVLYPEKVKTWKAMNFFKFTIGNAGGVIIKRNGELLPPLGKKGIVLKSVVITRDQVSIGQFPKTAPQPKKQEAPPVLLQPTEPKKITPTLRDTKQEGIRR